MMKMGVFDRIRAVAAITIFVLGFLLSYIDLTDAVLASPHPYQYQQPAGEEISLKIHGSSHFHWESDLLGFTVLKNEDTNCYHYAIRTSDGNLSSSTVIVGSAEDDFSVQGAEGFQIANVIAPGKRMHTEQELVRLGFEKRTLPSFEVMDAQNTLKHINRRSNTDKHRQRRTIPGVVNGTMKNIVVMIMWKDHAEDDRSVPSISDVDILMNHVGVHTLAPTGSVKDHYEVSSYGQLDLESTVFAWVNSSYTESEAANGQSGLGSQFRFGTKMSVSVSLYNPKQKICL